MTDKTHNWAVRRRHERDRVRAARQLSEILAQRLLIAQGMDRAGVRANLVGPIDSRFAYPTRSYD